MGAWLAALALSGAGSAQEGFPNRTVRVVNPYSAGSVADVFGRIVTQNMAAQWKASIILESKSGANGSLAAEDVARAAPDGYTWLLVTTFFTTSPSLNLVLRWDQSAAKSAPLGEFADIIKSDIALWAKVVKDASIPAD
jgi:tripartite-type tricarboxylate transporter receptor subunit TctC